MNEQYYLRLPAFIPRKLEKMNAEHPSCPISQRFPIWCTVTASGTAESRTIKSATAKEICKIRILLAKLEASR